MAIGDNVTAIKRFFREVFEEGNIDYIDTIIDPDYTFNGYPSSAARTKQWAKRKRTKYRNLRFEIEIVSADGNFVSFNWTMQGHNKEAGDELVIKKGFNQLVFRDGRCVSNRQTDSDTDHESMTAV